MKLISTRAINDQKEFTFSEAILNPSAKDGGLFVPKNLPKFQKDFFIKNKDLSYKELALEILNLFKIDIDQDVLKKALNLYDKFDNKLDPIPLVKIEDNLFVNELYHGPTRAFKDIALQPFGYILSHLAKKIDKKFLILAATSGDTGPATLNTFANKENIQVVCLYPDGGTSDVQRLQMVTQSAKNLKVLGVKGDFDDTQNALKTLLNSKDFKNKLQKRDIYLSAANSVNFGRIIFQIIYHVKGYCELLKKDEIKADEKIYIVVPSGNFGNALGAYYAKKMGLNVEKILIVSNKNNVLSEFINDGVYDIRKRKLIKTISPAMDILKSSNIERVLFDKFGAARVKELMDSLNKDHFFKLTDKELKSLQKDFAATYTDDISCKNYIKRFAKNGYILDPHSATCINAYDNLREKELKTIICSTAQWSKFAKSMLNAINEDDKNYDDKEALDEIAKKFNIKVTPLIMDLFNKKIIHNKVIDKDQIEKEILEFCH